MHNYTIIRSKFKRIELKRCNIPLYSKTLYLRSEIYIKHIIIYSLMKIKEVAETLERFAPLPLQESYDNAGLQIGLTAGENVSGVLLCLDVTEEVITEAEQLGCNLIVSHHPLLFRPLRHVTLQTQVERCVVMAIQRALLSIQLIPIWIMPKAV